MKGRRLTRDTRAAVIGGVAAGFADYFKVDPVAVRIAFVLGCLLKGMGLIFYLACWVIMPPREPSAGDEPADEARPREERTAGRGSLVAGLILVFLGAIFLMDRLPWFYHPIWIDWSDLWPVILIGIGAAILLNSTRRSRA